MNQTAAQRVETPVKGKTGVARIEYDGTAKLNLSGILDSVIHGDALEAISAMQSNCVDLVFLDPPYFLHLPGKDLKRWRANTVVEAVYDDWDKFDSFEQYDEFIRDILLEIRRVMKDTATIWVISTYHSLFRIGKIMQDMGFWFLNDVIWLKSNPMPNWLGVRFTNATETMIWALKSRESKGYAFNRDFAKSASTTRIPTNVWNIPVCSGKERLRSENGARVHSTQKPERLLENIILTSSREGDIVLDPMAGTGTSGFISRKLNRHFIMIEKNHIYVEQIIRRLS